MCIWRRVHLECTVCGGTGVIEYIDPMCNHEHDPIDEWFVEMICADCSDRRVLEEEETDPEDGHLMQYANFNAVMRRVDQNQDDHPDWYEPPGLVWDSETEDGSDHLSNFSERQNEDGFIHIVAEADPEVDHEAPWNSEDYFLTDEDESSGWSIDANSSDDEDDGSSDSTVVGDDQESSFDSDGSTLVDGDNNEYDADDEQSDEDSSDESDGESSDESDGDSSDESSIATVDHNDDGGWVTLVNEDFVLSDWVNFVFERCPPQGAPSTKYNNGSSSE